MLVEARVHAGTVRGAGNWLLLLALRMVFALAAVALFGQVHGLVMLALRVPYGTLMPHVIFPPCAGLRASGVGHRVFVGLIRQAGRPHRGGGRAAAAGRYAQERVAAHGGAGRSGALLTINCPLLFVDVLSAYLIVWCIAMRHCRRSTC